MYCYRRTIYNSANAVIHYRVPPPLNMLKVPCLLLVRLFDVLPKCIRPSRKRRYADSGTLMHDYGRRDRFWVS